MQRGWSQVPRLSRQTKVDVAKCHACQRRWMSPRATPATQSAAASRATSGAQTRYQSQPSAVSATPATQRECGCLKAPRLPRKTKVDVAKCHPCHVKRRRMPPYYAKCRGTTATNGCKLATRPGPVSSCHANAICPCRQVPHLPRKMLRPCRQVPRLPRKVPQRHGRPTALKRHQSQPSVISAAAATQMLRPCCV